MNNIDIKKQKLLKAFTLIEVMLLLVVLSLVFASSTSVITRKHKLKPRRSVHGSYICYRNRDDGNLHEIMYSGKSLLLENNQTTNPAFTECHFEAPKSASYLYIQLIGGGGAGGNANHSPIYNGGYSSGIQHIDLRHNDTTTGLTDDYIHSFKSNSYGGDVVTFSSKAFQKIMKDHGVKVFVFDYAGDGGTGGKFEQNYFTKSKDEIAPTDPEDAWFWYESKCKYSNSYTATQIQPLDCVKRAMYWNTKFSNNETVLNFGTDPAALYCQNRSPIYKNCPWIKKIFDPLVRTISCPGGAGGRGGLIVSPVVDMTLGIHFKPGERTKQGNNYDEYGNKLNDADWTIDFGYPAASAKVGKGYDCLMATNTKVNGSVGTFLTTAEACPDGIEGVCKDADGNEIKDPKDDGGFIISNQDYKYFSQRKEVCDENNQNCTVEYETVLGYQPIKNYYGYSMNSRYFKTFPVASHTIKLIPCKQADGTEGVATKGRDGGLPYYLDDKGAKVGEGIKFCVPDSSGNDECKYYTTTNTDLVSGGTNMLATGGNPAAVIPGMIDEYSLLKADANAACKTPEAAVSGARTFTKNSKYGNTNSYLCSGHFGFTHNYTRNADYDFLKGTSSSKDSYYPCPAFSSYGGTMHSRLISLAIEYRYERQGLYYGERGRAGAYKAIFARSFGNSALKMFPGRGGRALPLSVGSSTPANNGETSSLSADCDENGVCSTNLTVAGGLGGRSHFSETTEINYLSNQKIMEYIQNPAKAPETRESINKRTNTYMGEDSEFQQVSFLSDLSMIEGGEVIANIGKGGNGGYVTHHCWLQPQYFVYRSMNRYSGGTHHVIPNEVDDTNAPAGHTYDEWEGYTNFGEGYIRNLDVCKKDGKDFRYQFDETLGTNGYPGAIVIMW